jgi:methyl-accepting chemotaxis protein
MVALTLAAIVAMGLISLRTAGDIIKSEAQARLTSLAEAKAVQTFFGNIASNLVINAGDSITAEALVAFSDVFSSIERPVAELQRVYIDENPNPLGEKDRLVDADFDHPYARLHARYHGHFHRIQQSYGYYDVFLFDTAGNLVYSVFKERDYATNMNTGEWKDTDLAVIFRRAMSVDANEESVFEDFEPYAPSYDAPASFIGRSVFDASGQRVGVLAYQMPVDEIKNAVANIAGLGKTGDVFLVGSDGLLRSGSVQNELWLNLVFEWFEGWRRIWLNYCCETACQPKEIHHHGND